MMCKVEEDNETKKVRGGRSAEAKYNVAEFDICPGVRLAIC